MAEPDLLNAAEFATSLAVRPPLTAGIVAAAVQIINEDPGTGHHLERVNLAQRVVASPQQMTEQFIWLVSTNMTVVNKWVTGDRDGAINDFAFVIASIWDSIAVTG